VRIAEACRTNGCIPDLAEVRAAVPERRGRDPATTMPAAKVHAAETMSAEVAAAMMSATMTTAMVPTAMTTAMTAAVTAAMAAAVATPMTPAPRQSRARQQGCKRNRGNSNDRSQHRTLPHIRAH
jgi:phage-related tail fiber protein